MDRAWKNAWERKNSMDKEDVVKIKKAIRLIHHEEKHYEGLNILAKLVGWSEFTLPEKSISVFELLRKEGDRR